MTDKIENNYIEELKKEIKELKIRLERIEEFLLAFPSVEEYLSKDDSSSEDVLTEEAIKTVKQYRKASTSLLQRRLSIGYTRAARLMDVLEEKGIVGPAEGIIPRKVLVN